MADDNTKGSWWQTMPGILTAIAATVTALSGLIAALHQSGIFSHRDDPASQAASVTADPSQTGEPAIQRQAGASNADPSIAKPSASIDKGVEHAVPAADQVNVLSTENGGQLLLAPSRNWMAAIDGKQDEYSYSYVNAGEDGVFAFKNEQPAVISSIGWLIQKKGSNLKQFELLVADQAPEGPYRSMGKFDTQDLRVMRTDGWQDFKFTPTSAKYVKLRLLSGFDSTSILMYEVRVMGSLKSR